jgi:hypothetical protein
LPQANKVLHKYTFRRFIFTRVPICSTLPHWKRSEKHKQSSENFHSFLDFPR